MKTKIIGISILTMLIILITSITYAATGNVELKSNVNEVKKGETFDVTISATSEDGINGIDTKIIYDSNKLELVSGGLIDSSKWASLGTSNTEITVICNSTETIKQADIYTLKFKVKDSVSEGSKVEVETSEIMLDTNARNKFSSNYIF